MIDSHIIIKSALHRHDIETDRNAKFLIIAIRFLEESSLLPEKLTRAGRDKWETYMENLRLADLVEFAVTRIAGYSKSVCSSKGI